MSEVRVTDWQDSDLHIAALDGDLERLRQVFAEEGYEDYNIKDQGGITPLYLAAQKGHVDVCKEILSVTKDASPRWQQGGATPLIMAAQNGHKEVCWLLLLETRRRSVDSLSTGPGQTDACKEARKNAQHSVLAWRYKWPFL